MLEYIITLEIGYNHFFKITLASVFTGICCGMGNILACVLQGGIVSPTEAKGNGNSSTPKAQTPEENKRPDTLLTRFDRRDNLKKANTLPTSVTGAFFFSN